MSTDRELLEKAARAAGYPPEWRGSMRVETDTGPRWWNPLADDADAFRLAVKLGLNVCTPTEKHSTAFVQQWHGLGPSASEPAGSDPYAATRRCIVRAAASIGEEA